MAGFNLDLFPEIIAAVAFLPIGFALTYILHYPALSVALHSSYYDVLWVPYLIIALCAIVTCIVMHTMKRIFNRYKFENFYIIIVGLLLLLLAGVAMILYQEHNDSRVTMYAIAPAIGIIYVPAITYIHARAKDYRHIKMSMCHIFYIIGFILGTVIINNYPTYTLVERTKMNQIYGYVLAPITFVVIVLFLVNEILQFRYKTYFNYKQPTDYNMDYENKFKTIFLKSYYKNTSPQNVDLNLNNYKLNPFKMIGYVAFAIIIKLVGLVYFYYPLLILNATNFSGDDLFYCYLISAIGLVVSTILVKFINVKTNFLASLILKIISFLLLILFLNVYKVTDNSFQIFYWIHTIFLLYGYNLNDILLMELTKLQYTEVVQTVGLILELLVNGTLQYFLLTSPSSIFNIKETIAIFLLDHIIPIVICLLLILFITILVLPDIKDDSVLEIQNKMFFKIYDLKKSNGSGTSIQPPRDQPVEYDARPHEYTRNPNMDEVDNSYPNSQFRQQQPNQPPLQTISMTSSTATSMFNYQSNPYNNDPYSDKRDLIQQRSLPPEEPPYDYSQIKPQPLFPRPRPSSAGNFSPFYRS